MNPRKLKTDARFLRTATILDDIFQRKPTLLRPRVMMLLLASFFLVCATGMLYHNVTERVEPSHSVKAREKGAKTEAKPGTPGSRGGSRDQEEHSPHLYGMLRGGDSASYLAIARSFAQGDFSCSYVARRPHRQPLYPLLLAVPQWMTGGSIFWLGSVNVLAGLAILLLLYQSSLQRHRNGVIAACLCLLIFTNRFLMDEVTAQIMTEPVFILFCMGAIHYFLQYATHRRRQALLAASACLSLSYLTRPNGIVLMAAMAATICLAEGADFLRSPAASRPTRFRRLQRTSADLGMAAVLFAVIALPSWLPRWYYLHNPVTHGYLNNFMWVDTYQQGHTGLPYVSFHFADYARTHSFTDFLGRWGYGLFHVLLRTPVGQEIVPLLYLLAVGGVYVAIVRRKRTYCLLIAFCLIQMLPLIWTKLSNPNDRVPYSALLPFEFFFAGFALRTAATWAARKRQMVRGAGFEPATSCV